MKVLVVDDEPVIGKMVKTALENRGHEVMWMESAEGVLEAVESFSPDVILLDINMPGRSGFDALSELKSSGSDIPVIVMSVLSQDFNIEKAYDLGARDYVIKPFSLNHLIRKLESLK